MKKIFIALLTIVLIFSLVSCGKSEKGKKKEQSAKDKVEDQRRAEELEKELKTLIVDYEMEYGKLIEDGEEIEIIWQEDGAYVYSDYDLTKFDQMINQYLTDDDLVRSDSTGNYATAYIYGENDSYVFDISFDGDIVGVWRW